ncbi:MAG TPA: histidine kinase dimerization/phosphoacceptor domain -containing protein [Puia sp.]
MQSGQSVLLRQYLRVLEDRDGTADPRSLAGQSASFVPLDSLHPRQPTDYYWLKTVLRTDTGMAIPNLALSFTHLTYVDTYLFRDSVLLWHREAGAFRKQSAITDGDGRLFNTLVLEPGKEYTLLIRVHHTKHYQPQFDFAIQRREFYFMQLHKKELWEAALQGAVCVFFLYTLLSWMVSRFRPYLWLLLFIAGASLYVISSGGYIIEWFFPEDPPTGWLFNIHFVYAGLLGLYLLLAEFWQLKRYNPTLYRWGQGMIVLLLCCSITCFTIDYTTGNFNLANNVNLMAWPLKMIFLGCLLYFCWRRLSHAQRYLAYGILLFGAASLLVTLNSVFTHEKALAITPIIVDVIILCVFLLFSTGLKEEMRQHEIAKQLVLEELTRLQKHQNILLEKKVEERTEELNISNRRLLKQKTQLTERNVRIETLINELNHRVKNNLQMLYSLLSLQLPIVNDDASRDMLRGNIGKIRAMMLVNQKLFDYEKGGSISLREFVCELASHLQKIYDTRGRTRILPNIPAGIRLNDKYILSFGLILSELLTNTFKHAFEDHPDPCIQVEVVTIDAHLLQFVYSDNGKGLKEEETGKKFTMGIPLIRDLVRQMNGSMVLEEQSGLSYSFTIPV